jgi:FMN phosphatase YigB (HAD superfamily)/glycosyltransferase involved in cell wall biosynthesis
MTVAIVHYHLADGGVSRVISSASRVLAASGIRHVILVGSLPEEPAGDLPLRVVAGLGYLETAGDLTAGELTERLRKCAIDALGQAPEVWHFHNHSLGKNPLLAGVVAHLAEEGERLVLQIHDLAEEGRPGNYQVVADCQKLYPVSSRVHYAFLNSRDMHVFTTAGLPVEHAWVLPNPVSAPASLPPNDGRAPVLFAPVRGIRRKNLGELVFLSALAADGVRFAVSRAPLDPEALAIHDTWRRFAERHRLPIGFDVVDRFTPAPGAPAGFESWLNHATHFVTTSVAEGFGLTFLEAAAFGKPLIGRNLPHITAEHARHGIRAGNLYDHLLVPIEWIDLTILRSHLATTLERHYRSYRRPLSNETVAATLDALVHDGWLDFGNLPEALQQGAIERLADKASRRIPLVRIGDRTRPVEDWLADAIANRVPSATPCQLRPYSPASYQRNTASLYSALMASPESPVEYLSGADILSHHLRPESFHFLLSASAPRQPPKPFRAVVFDIYGTLLIAPAGGVKPDPAADPLLRRMIESFGHVAPESPSTKLHAAVLRHHAAAGVPFPEVDLRVLWREILSLEPGTDTTELVTVIEAAWHPVTPMPGAQSVIQRLSRSGISLGLLSNAQCNTLASLGCVADLFAPELTLLSFQHGIAKPDPALFEMLADRLAGRGIAPSETLYVGNDPSHDIIPAAAAGFKTALFAGHPDSLRPGECAPDFTFHKWADLITALQTTSRITDHFSSSG